MCLLSSLSSVSILSFDIPIEAVRGNIDPVLRKAWKGLVMPKRGRNNDRVLWISG